jgi:cobaltochelatase CobS
VALIFDEYDAMRPDVAFLLTKVLEAEGGLTLLEKNKVIKPNSHFRLFATANTVGLGDTKGIYSGVNQINAAQMDRWNILTSLNYLSLEKEMEIVLAKNKSFNNSKGKDKVANMIKVATLTRKGFMAGDISTVMSPRTVIFWCENTEIFKDIGYAFRVTFLNKCDESEKSIIAEYYQRCFGEELPESMLNLK